MGAHGVGVFDDDVAFDARAAMLDLFRAGLSVQEATDAVLEELDDDLQDEEDAPVIILALAAAQWEVGRLDPRIKSQALQVIAEGVDFRWQDSPYSEQRRAVLAELGIKLNHQPPPPVPLEQLPDP